MARQLKSCGTLAAYRRHLAHGEPTCRACRDAASAVGDGRRPRAFVRGPNGMSECGTPQGHGAHRYRGEPSCDACRDAVNAYQREWRARRAEKRLRAVELDRLLAEAWAEVSA